jgi:hypothetical protein
MKRKCIVALAALTFYIGITNDSKAQDSTVTFVNYLFKTPWIVSAGYSFVSNNNIIEPWDVTVESMDKFGNLQSNNYHPSRFTLEKGLFANNKKAAMKGFALQLSFSRQGFKPVAFAATDLNLKYNLNKLWLGEDEKGKWFDPYLTGGTGFSVIRTYQIDTVYKGNHQANGPVNQVLDQQPVLIDWTKDHFLTLNFGLGVNLWINDYVGLNLEAQGKTHFLERTVRNRKSEGTNYTQYTVGVVFKIGSQCKAEVQEEVVPVCTYKRSKEEEDALIHLREHLNE